MKMKYLFIRKRDTYLYDKVACKELHIEFNVFNFYCDEKVYKIIEDKYNIFDFIVLGKSCEPNNSIYTVKNFNAS